MSSRLLDAVNSVLGAAAAVPHDWGANAIVHSRPANLFQLVRMWNDQVNREKDGSGYSFEKPACFLELRNMGNEMMGSGLSLSEYVWRLHIVDMQLDAGDDVGMDQNLTVMAYRDKTKQALAGFQPPNCSTLFTVNEEQDYTHTDVYHYILDLKSSFTDTKGTTLDPDQTTVQTKEPPTNMELDIAYTDANGDPVAPQLTLNITP